jgi:Pyruvate/2-oxoacid:ferredoxin oxidoreductase gamma subunit
MARENNIAVSPSQGGGGTLGTTLEGLAGEPKLQKTLSKGNAPRINMLVRRDLGMSEDEPLTRANFARIRKDSGEAYAAIKDIGEIPTDALYKNDLSNVVKTYDTAAKSFKHRSENPFAKTLEGLNVDAFDSAAAIEEVKLLRQDADAAFADRKSSLGKAYKDAAEAVDSMLDRHLTNMVMTGADPAITESVTKYRAARQRIAKTYTAEKALNDATGNINAAVYARELQRGKPLSGAGKAVGQIAQAFPRSVQQIEKSGSTGPTIFDLAPAVMGKEALLIGARPAARHIMASDAYQSMFTRYPDYQPNFAMRLSDLLTDDAAVGAAAAMQGAQQRNK